MRVLVAGGAGYIQSLEEQAWLCLRPYPRGITHRTQLAAGFIKRKMAEFEAIQAELDQIRREFVEDPTNLARK